MDAKVMNVQAFFSGQHRYVVPAYQRPYVWTEEDQWEPFWEDIERIADGRLAGDEPTHFLGAVVVRRERTPVGGVTEWSVIDGQQRLTTLQICMATLARAAAVAEQDLEARRLEDLLRQPEHFASGDDRYKFWPTSANRSAFRDVIDASHEATPADDPENTIHEASAFFEKRIDLYVHQDGASPQDTAGRFAALREAITGLLHVVGISLDKDDPAQLIFETLNARGTPLLAMDLVKNALFDLARQQGASVDDVHQNLWQPQLGDHDYWAKEQRLGRVRVPRGEAFLYHWLVMATGEVVKTERLFETFRRAVLEIGPARNDAREVIETLNRDAGVLRRLNQRKDLEPEAGQFMRTLDDLDTTTMVPVALWLHRTELEPDRRSRATRALESYLVRRLLRGLSTKNYSQLAARVLGQVQDAPESTDDVILGELLTSTSDTYRWPTDAELREHLRSQPLYGWLGQRRIVFVLSRIEQALRTRKSEALELPRPLQIEHVLPQSWRQNWPLPDDPELVRRRNLHLNLLGNLTLVTGQLNASLSNGPWPVKRQGLHQHSLLLLNRALSEQSAWDESAIAARGEQLTEVVLDVWRGPQTFMPEQWKPPEAESWPEHADMSLEDVATAYKEGSELMRALLKRLAEEPGKRWSYEGFEAELGWPRGRVAGVFGGYAQGLQKRLGGKRPWHIHLRGDGVWELWMDDARSEIVRTAA